ncbi:MAG: peptidylprolyl isomerase [Clostridia bacterium]|nr:peptidylprolyl isomerase [Clostridia bacterium]
MKTKTIKKQNFLKMIAMLVALIFAFVPMLAGCDLVTLNEGLYLSQTVGSWGTITITKEDLIRAYNNYGNSTYDSSSTPTKEGVESTLDLLLKRAVMVQYLTDPANGKEGKAIVTLTMAQQNDIWRSVYSSINSSVKSLEDTLRADENATLSTSTNSEEDSDVSEYAPYEPTYNLVWDSANNVYKLEKIEETPVVENVSVQLYDRDDATLTTAQKAKLAYDQFTKNWLKRSDSSDYTDRAFSRYINNLLKGEKGRGLSEDEKEAFLREVDRLYKIYYDNSVLSLSQKLFEKDLVVTTEMVQQKFLELYNGQKELYDLTESNYKTNMQATSTTAYYNPAGQAENWFEVYHLLVGYSDEQNTELTNLKTMLNNEEISLAEYNKLVANVKANTIATNRFTGETMNYNELINKVQTVVNSQTSFAAKVAKFREFVYAYSTDTNSINTENGMNIPTNKDLDNMVEEFATASRALHEAGSLGALSDAVQTTYGYHVIMYLGDVPNVVYSTNTNLLMTRLNSALLTKVTNKTMLDKVIEQISLDTYADHELSFIEQIMDGVDTIYYLDAYKDMFQ